MATPTSLVSIPLVAPGPSCLHGTQAADRKTQTHGICACGGALSYLALLQLEVAGSFRARSSSWRTAEFAAGAHRGQYPPPPGSPEDDFFSCHTASPKSVQCSLFRDCSLGLMERGRSLSGSVGTSPNINLEPVRSPEGDQTPTFGGAGEFAPIRLHGVSKVLLKR